MSGLALALRIGFGLAAGALAGRVLQPVARRLGGASPVVRALPPACALLAAAVLGLVSPAGTAALDLGLAMALALLSVVDIAAWRLPDVLTLPLIAAGLAEAFVVRDDVGGRLLGAGGGYLLFIALGALFRWRTGRDGLGAGDAKLFAASGAWLGWEEMPAVLLIACGVTLVVFAARALKQGAASLRRPVPLGPGLCAGFLVVRLLAAA